MEIFSGIGSGIIMGLMMIIFKKCHMMIKFVLSVLITMGLVAIHIYYHLFAGEFLCAVIFGMVL